jgi:anhydro-N-acetylmuramic acid kinase
VIVAGIMSGTSLDGIDVAIVDVRGVKFRALAHATAPYPAKVRAGLLAISNCETHTARIAEWNFRLAELYAAAVKRVWKKPLDLVGCHGQTIYHARDCTLQIGSGSVLAERIGAPVVSDFRLRDMAAGGRGAPLVPFFDYRLLRHRTIARVALNIGGIANVTILPAGATLDDVLAFDTGPGNMVMDQLVARMTGGRFDRGGRIAARGKLDEALLAKLLRDPYLPARPPKTAGREQYGAGFADRFPATPDGVRTAAAFTAACASEGIRRFGPSTRELVASGGGVHNPGLMG